MLDIRLGEVSDEHPCRPRCCRDLHEPNSVSIAASGSFVHQLASSRVRACGRIHGGGRRRAEEANKLRIYNPGVKDGKGYYTGIWQAINVRRKKIRSLGADEAGNAQLP